MSDDVLSERTLPASIVFVGGGVIALEFSHVYARAGAKVTILEALPRLLDNMDAAHRHRADRGRDPHRDPDPADRTDSGKAPRNLSCGRV